MCHFHSASECEKKFHFSDRRELLFPDSLFLRCRLFWATCRSSGCLGNGSPLRRLAQCHTFFCVCLSVSVSLWMETVWVWSKKGGVWRARAESKENWEREDDIPSDKWVGVTVLSEAAKRNTGAWSEACPLSSSTRPWPLYLWSVYMLEGAIKMKMLTIFSSFLPRTHTHTHLIQQLCLVMLAVVAVQSSHCVLN